MSDKRAVIAAHRGNSCADGNQHSLASDRAERFGCLPRGVVAALDRDNELRLRYLRRRWQGLVGDDRSNDDDCRVPRRAA